MSLQNNNNQGYENLSDGFSLSGGTVPRKLTLTDGDVTIEGNISGSTVTFPAGTFTVAKNDGSNLTSGAVKTAAIEDGAVTSPKIPDGEIPASKLDFDSGIWWEELGRATVTGSPSSTITASGLPVKKYIKIIARSNSQGGTTRHSLRFNGDSGNNYAARSMDDYTAPSFTNVSTSQIQMSTASVGIKMTIVELEANGTDEKNLLFNTTMRSSTGAGNANSSRTGTGKWTGSANISSISIVNNDGSGNFSLGSQFIVLGHD